MRDIVFAHTHTKYDSYTDYRRLVELAKFESGTVDDINVNRDAVYITCPHNGETNAALEARPKADRKCKIALWFLERPAGSAPGRFPERIKELISEQLDYIIFSDVAMYNLVKHIDGTVFVPCGSHPDLGTLEDRGKPYDFCHMSYVWGRRGIMNEINAHVGENGWGDARHDTLLKSKYMLNIHQDNDGYHEPLRFALCAAYGIPLISEYCIDPFPYIAGTDFISVHYNDIKRRTSELIRAYDGHKEFGKRLFEKAMREFPFEQNVKEFVASLD